VMSNEKAEKYRALAMKAVAEAEKAKEPHLQQEFLDIAERYNARDRSRFNT